MLVERIGMDRKFDPFAASGNDRQYGRPRLDHPHIVLQLRHMLCRSGFLRECPRQHELGLEHGASALDDAVQGRRHPAQSWMLYMLLDIPDHQPGIELVPAPIEVLGDRAELDHQIVRQVLRLDLAPFFPPQTEQGRSRRPP